MAAFREIVDVVSVFVLPLLIVLFPAYGILKKVPVYEVFVEGAREGFDTAVRIIPYLVAILFAVGMVRASGLMEFGVSALAPAARLVGLPPEALPMALVRPLTGGGSVGVLSELNATYGPQSAITRTAAVIFGSTETTFYVIAVYFGAVGVKKTRHALPAGLIADFSAILVAGWAVRLFFG